MLVNENYDVSEVVSKRFSIVMPFHNNETYLADSIDSIVNQNLDFMENVQLILVDCGSEDESFAIAAEYEKKYHDNIFLIASSSQKIAEGANVGFNFAKGEYVSFMSSLDKLHEDGLLQILKAFKKHKEAIISLPVSFFSSVNHTPKLYNHKGIVDLEKFPKKSLKSIYSVFFKKSIIDDLRFDNHLRYSYGILYITKALLKTKKYLLLDTDAYYFYRTRNSFDHDLLNDYRFYLTEMKYFLLDLVEYASRKYGEVAYFIKLLVLEKFPFFYKDTPIKEVLSDDELSDFFDSMKKVLTYFEVDEIRQIVEDQSSSSFLIAVKNEDISAENIKNSKEQLFDVKITKDNVCVYSKDILIDDLSERPIMLDFVTLRDDILYFSGYIKSILNKDNISIHAIKEYEGGDVEIINATSFDYSTRSSSYMMGLEWEHVHNFDLEVPIKTQMESSKIKLIVSYEDNAKKAKMECPIQFREYCNISHVSNYYAKNNRIIMFNGRFNVMPYSYLKMVNYELKGIVKVLRNRDLFFEQALFFRLLNLLLYPYMRNKEIWIIMDRKHSADDNAEHFYKYAIKQDDGIKKFFTIYQDTPDFERLEKRYGNVLPFESVKHRFYYTFADKIISSQGSEFYLNPFRNRRYYQTAGISNVDFYFLQHGIIKDNMSSWLRKYDRNPKLIVTSAQLEYDSLFDDGYNYGDDVIQLLGLPRYDNLNNQGLKKQIVIMPSWRNYLTDENDVLNSEYFKRFNSLVNNERLINHSKKKGYEIVFKPHPELVDYIDLFDKNDYVEIDEHKKYQDIFNESSLLVTDYSSIFFDFSYLKKPLIYYQYGNDYHYDSDNGYFQYETMGFGPVIKDEDDLVDKLIEYMDNDCVMEDVYKKRVDDFFKYHDRNNSKRCYDWILRH